MYGEFGALGRGRNPPENIRLRRSGGREPLLNALTRNQPRTQDLSLGKTLAAAGHVPHQKFSARGGVGKVSNYINMLKTSDPRTGCVGD